MITGVWCCGTAVLLVGSSGRDCAKTKEKAPHALSQLAVYSSDSKRQHMTEAWCTPRAPREAWVHQNSLHEMPYGMELSFPLLILAYTYTHSYHNVHSAHGISTHFQMLTVGLLMTTIPRKQQLALPSSMHAEAQSETQSLTVTPHTTSKHLTQHIKIPSSASQLQCETQCKAC